MERFTVRLVDAQEIEAGVECYECDQPAKYVEELVHPLGDGQGFVTKLYYCEAHKDNIHEP